MNQMSNSVICGNINIESKHECFSIDTLVAPPDSGLPEGIQIERMPFGGYDDKNRIATKWARKLANRAKTQQRKQEETAILDSGAMGIYLQPKAPMTNVNPDAPPIKVGTASGQPHKSRAVADLHVPTPKGSPP